MKKLLIASFVLASFNSMALDLSCFGTEPFWGLKLTDKTITYSSPEQEEDMVLKVLAKNSAVGSSENFAFVVDTKYSSLTVISGECNDGMSDGTYPYHAVFKRDNVVLYGCCEPTTK